MHIPPCSDALFTCSSRKILWGSKIMQEPPIVTYEEAMAEDERGLFKWLSKVVRSFVAETLSPDLCLSRTNLASASFPVFPPHPKLRRNFQDESDLFERRNVCPRARTRANEHADRPLSDGTFWDFTSDLAKGDTAYTTLALGAHTDTTYFVRTLNASYPPHPLIGRPPDGPLRSSAIPPS